MSGSFRRPAPLQVGRRLRARLGLEALEERAVPAQTFTVNSLGDDPNPAAGQVTLRSAINMADADTSAGVGGDLINFAPNLTGTITLTLPTGGATAGSDMKITRSLSIQGPGADKITVQGNAAGRIFTVDDGNTTSPSTVSISGLTLQGGTATGGGAIQNNNENLTLQGIAFVKNTATGGATGGGAVLSDTSSAGALAISQCTFTGNSADQGGAISVRGLASIDNSTLFQNNASGRGGAVFAGFTTAAGSIQLRDDTIVGNTASNGGGVFADVPAIPTVADSIVAQNQAPTSPDVGGTLAPKSHNNFVGGNPKLDSTLRLNAGGTTGTLAPLSGSPVIDQGVGNELLVDQNGTARPIGPAPDIGAVESPFTGTENQPPPASGGQTQAQLNALINQLVIANLQAVFAQPIPPGSPILAAVITAIADANGDGYPDVSAIVLLKSGKRQTTIIRLTFDGLSPSGGLVGQPMITTM